MGEKIQLTVLTGMCTFITLSRRRKNPTEQKGKTRA